MSFLKTTGSFGEEVYAPLPVIHADRAGDDLLDLVAVAAADQAVLVHHALALGEGHGVPVDLLAALAVHGIEAEVFGVGDGGEEARGHGVGADARGWRRFRRSTRE